MILRRSLLALSLLVGCPSTAADDDDDDSGGCTEATWFIDYDSDGFGSDAYILDACEAPAGYVGAADDCDDTDPDVHPGTLELCDGVDNNCDGSVDTDVVEAPPWYLDGDGDGFGDSADSERSCAAPDGRVANGDDCDDEDPAVHPGVEEVCDGVDNDCDGGIDVDATDAPTWYLDGDGDGFGDPSTGTTSCVQPPNTVAMALDCDDSNPSVRPGVADPCNAVDDDCDGSVDEDVKAGWSLVTVDTEAGWIYEIDTSNAVMTAISPVEIGLFINSLDVWEGGQPIVHASEGLQLLEIDICTGETQTIGPTGVGDMGGISFRSGYRLYGLDFNADALIELDPWTGVGTPIGSLGFNVGPDGLAYDCSTDTLFGADAYTGDVFVIDPNTGIASGFVNTGVPFQYVGLEFDHADRTLLAATGDALYRIDPATGASTYIGDLDGVRINDLAFHPACP